MENNFAGKRLCSLSYPEAWARSKILFTPKLTDYFIQGLRNIILSCNEGQMKSIDVNCISEFPPFYLFFFSIWTFLYIKEISMETCPKKCYACCK
jgi:hypothetical protein